MKFAILFKLFAVVAVVGTIFGAGVLVGGSFATGVTQEGALRQVEHCLPAESAEQLRPCLAPNSVDGGEGQ